MARMRTPQANDDGWTEWEMPLMQGYRMGCCDCGAVHDVEWQVVKIVETDARGMREVEAVESPLYRVLMRVRANRRSTAQVRRHKRTQGVNDA